MSKTFNYRLESLAEAQRHTSLLLEQLNVSVNQVFVLSEEVAQLLILALDSLQFVCQTCHIVMLRHRLAGHTLY